MSVPSEEEESEFHKQKTLHLLYSSVLLDTLYEFVKNRRGGGLEELSSKVEKSDLINWNCRVPLEEPA